MNFSTRVRVYRYKLSDLEDDIADYVLHHRAEVVQMKIVTLAEHFFTVPNTVSRLCHKLRYSGYLELKTALKAELEAHPVSHLTQREVLRRNFDLIDPEKEVEIVAVFHSAARINVFAIGSTAFAARIIVDDFNALEYKFVFYEYEHELAQKIKTAQNEVFFFISLSGEREPLLSLAAKAREIG